MTPLSQMMYHNNPIIKMIFILQRKWKLTEDIINNLIALLLEESCILLEKQNDSEYLKVKDTLSLVESINL